MDVFLYLDPPYYRTDDALGISWTIEEHEKLFDHLMNLKGKWLLTYNDAPEIRDLYKQYKIEEVTLPKVAPDSKQTDGIRDYYTHLIIASQESS